MTLALVLVGGLLVEVPIVVLAIVGLAVVKPAVVAVGCGVVVASALVRTGSGDREVAMLATVASELRAGSSLRSAVVSMARDGGGDLDRLGRMAQIGLPMTQVAAEFESQLGAQGRIGGAAMRLVSTVGGRTASVFESLAVMSNDEVQLRREGAAATAAVRFSMLILGGLPVLLVVWQVFSGRMLETLQLPLGGVVVGLGVTLVSVGSAVSMMLSRLAVR